LGIKRKEEYYYKPGVHQITEISQKAKEMLILYELYLHCLKPQLKVNRILQKNFD